MIARMRSSLRLVAGISLLFVFAAGALAQGVTVHKSPSKATRDHASLSPPQATVAMPNAEKIVLLLRSTLVTLNDAIQTGNFTVLRDRGAPGFRDANSAAKLSQAFSAIASKGVDLAAVTIISPQLTEPPGLDQQKGMLHLKGYFPGQPVQIDFEILYQAVQGQWRLFGLSVQPAKAIPPAAAAPAQNTTAAASNAATKGR
jgi:hypothetical protein